MAYHAGPDKSNKRTLLHVLSYSVSTCLDCSGSSLFVKIKRVQFILHFQHVNVSTQCIFPQAICMKVKLIVHNFNEMLFNLMKLFQRQPKVSHFQSRLSIFYCKPHTLHFHQIEKLIRKFSLLHTTKSKIILFSLTL